MQSTKDKALCSTARIKKLLAKYGDDVELQNSISVGFTVFTILFIVHILTVRARPPC